MTEYGIITYTRLEKGVRKKLDHWAKQEQRSTAAQIAVIIENAVREREQQERELKLKNESLQTA